MGSSCQFGARQIDLLAVPHTQAAPSSQAQGHSAAVLKQQAHEAEQRLKKLNADAMDGPIRLQPPQFGGEIASRTISTGGKLKHHHLGSTIVQSLTKSSSGSHA